MPNNIIKNVPARFTVQCDAITAFSCRAHQGINNRVDKDNKGKKTAVFRRLPENSPHYLSSYNFSQSVFPVTSTLSKKICAMSSISTTLHRHSNRLAISPWFDTDSISDVASYLVNNTLLYRHLKKLKYIRTKNIREQDKTEDFLIVRRLINYLSNNFKSAVEDVFDIFKSSACQMDCAASRTILFEEKCNIINEWIAKRVMNSSVEDLVLCIMQKSYHEQPEVNKKGITIAKMRQAIECKIQDYWN